MRSAVYPIEDRLENGFTVPDQFFPENEFLPSEGTLSELSQILMPATREPQLPSHLSLVSEHKVEGFEKTYSYDLAEPNTSDPSLCH